MNLSPGWTPSSTKPSCAPRSYLTTCCTLRSLLTALGGLGIRSHSGLAGELACIRTRTVFYEFAEQFSPQLLQGASEDFRQPIFLGAAENLTWMEVAGLFGEEPSPEDDTAYQPHLGVLPGVRRAIATSLLHRPPLFSSERSDDLNASESGARRLTSRPRAKRSRVSGSITLSSCFNLVGSSG